MPINSPKLQPMPRVKLTLRDYFAAKAMQGMWSSQTVSTDKLIKNPASFLESMAGMAYIVADAMIKERSKSNKYDLHP